MENSLVNQVLDECSQFRVLVVGSTRGKAQLIREIFGVNRLTRYPADISRDEEIYSKENEYFVAHVFDDWTGVGDVIGRRRKGEPDEVIHCIWHYVDAQDANALMTDQESDQICPDSIRRQGIPIITIFGRFDNIVTRASEIGSKRRTRTEQSVADIQDGIQLRTIAEAINLYCLQYPSTVAITSKSPGSKLTLLKVVLESLKGRNDLQLLLVIAQRLDPSMKFETSITLAMKQFLLGTVSTASPLPIPFAGLIGSSAATYMIKEDILRVWNIYDPDYLCAGAQGESSLMDKLLKVPEWGAKRVVYALPVIAQIKGVWETPKMAKALGSLMIDLTLLMERAFLATMSGMVEGPSPMKTPAKMTQLLAAAAAASGTPRTPSPSMQSQYGRNGVRTPVSAEVLRNRAKLLSPTGTGNDAAPRTPVRPSVVNLIDLSGEERPATPPRPQVRAATSSTSCQKPELPPKPPPKPARPSTSQSVMGSKAVPHAAGVQAIELSTPMSKAVVDIQIRPASQPLTRRMLEDIMQDYQPVQAVILEELSDFFNQEGEGLKRSFQKDTVRAKIDDILRMWRLTDVVEL